jgi:hypothetical protein
MRLHRDMAAPATQARRLTRGRWFAEPANDKPAINRNAVRKVANRACGMCAGLTKS